MKANAPKKIYIQPNAHDGWFESNPHSNIFVEYIRKDSFIENACEWLEPVLKNYAGYYAGKDTLEDFRKYMKGE